MSGSFSHSNFLRATISSRYIFINSSCSSVLEILCPDMFIIPQIDVLQCEHPQRFVMSLIRGRKSLPYENHITSFQCFTLNEKMISRKFDFGDLDPGRLC